jgi:hypothetical protein
MIGISGLARSGKDTLAENLANIIRNEWDIDVEIFSFAEEIKSQADDFLKKYYNISAFSESTKEKEHIRPLLVAHGECMKSLKGKNIWAEIVLKKIKSRKSKVFPIISDVRFDFEAKFLQKNKGQVIHISKIGNLAPNEIEAKNDPIVKKFCDIKHSWPVYEPNQMSECRGHAEILWQIIRDNNEWKQIYI